MVCSWGEGGGIGLSVSFTETPAMEVTQWRWARIDGEGLPLSTGSNFGEIGLVFAVIWGMEGGGVLMTMIIIKV